SRATNPDMEPLVVVLGGAALAAILGALRQRTSQLWKEQTQQARELGLRVTDLGRWVGRPEGVFVVVQVDVEPHDPWSVRAKLPFQAPRGFTLGPGATGHDARLLRAALDPLLERIERRGWRVELGPGIAVRRPRQFSPFTAAQRQVELASAVRCVVDLYRALEQRYRDLIEGGRRRLAASSGGTPRSLGLRGCVDGVMITVIGPQLEDGSWTLEVRAAIAPPLPPGTRVTAQGTRTRGDRLGDLVLDHALQIVSDDPEALGRRLARDDVRGPVLDVLAAHPESVLRADEVVHVVTDGALDVEASVRRVVELVTVLASVSPTEGDHATA
ncbi:MAG: hypothetical protein AAF211_08815, partial [Myxococcota bacterium]